MSNIVPLLMARDQFRAAVFLRDRDRCVFCDAPAQDAHHIMERRLWSDGGYYLGNGASVCAAHHLECERTTISVEQVRDACRITRAVLPEHLYDDQAYDKWGNPVLPNGTRMRGELFFDESVQKVLSEGNVLPLFTNRVRHPRTHHLPWSASVNEDDRTLTSLAAFTGQRVVVTRKMDGEQTSMYTDYIHARSLDTRGGIERDWVKRFHAGFAADIPEDWRVCGENLFGRRSIPYQGLPTYFMGFGVWNDRNLCLSWDDTKLWFDLLGVTPVPVLYDGLYDETAIRALYDEQRDWAEHEGYVMRLACAIPYARFRFSVGKYVRLNHIQTVRHGINRLVVKNGLAI